MKKLIILLLGLSGSAQATPVTWYVDATFTSILDGTSGTLIGSFDIDQTTGQFGQLQTVVTNMNVTATCVGTCADVWSQHYMTDPEPCCDDGDNLFNIVSVEQPDPDWLYERRTMLLSVDYAITSAQSGTYNLGYVDGSYVYSSNLSYLGPPLEECPGELLAQCEVELIGTISTVPIPAAVWLFASGLGLLGWFRRRQTA